MPAYRCRTFSVATNKCPILPYRGVARTGVCFALELMLDLVAAEAGLEPGEVRLRNLVRPEQMPFDNITKKHFDSGDYPEAMRRALASIDVEGVRARQRKGEADGRRIGVGFSIYCEQAAHGTSVYSGWGIPMVPGHEQASARLTPDGGLELRVGVHSHGQGMETTLAQVAHEMLGIDVAQGAPHPRRHRDDAVLHGHLGLALDGDGRRRGRNRLPRTGRARQDASAPSCCSTIRPRWCCRTARFAASTAASP